MKKNIFLSTMLVILFCGLIFGVIYLNDPTVFKTSDETSKSDVPVMTIEYRVQSGEILHTYETSGEVISNAPEIYTEKIIVEGINSENFELLKRKGDIIAPDDVLYKFKGAEKQIGFNAQLVNIEYNREENESSAVLTLLNYDKLFIAVQIGSDRISDITYDTPTEVIIDGKSYQAQITDIGYEISNGKVNVLISLPARVRPGTAADIVFTIDKIQAGMYVSRNAVYREGEDYFADVKTNNGTEQRKITVGQLFTVEQDGSNFEYAEILAGLSANDIILVEQIDNTGSKLKEHFENE